MKILDICSKSLREQIRDRWVLVITILTAPFFVFLYWLAFGHNPTVMNILVLNNDRPVTMGEAAKIDAGKNFVEALRDIDNINALPTIKISAVSTKDEAIRMIGDRKAALLVSIPKDFSEKILKSKNRERFSTTSITFSGELTNPQYPVAAAIVGSEINKFVEKVNGQHSPVHLLEEPLGTASAASSFEMSVPGLIIFSVLMLIFPMAMSLTRENEAGTLDRLKMSKVNTYQLLSGVVASHLLIAGCSIALTFAMAVLLGFHSQGPLFAAVMIGLLASLAVLGVAMIVASFARNTTEAFVVGNIPLVLFMFFSGAMFPVAGITILKVAGREISVFDALPPTHAVIALNKVLTFGAGFTDVIYELTALIVLAGLYFSIGYMLYNQRHMRIT